jgi:hypothetical protein
MNRRSIVAVLSAAALAAGVAAASAQQEKKEPAKPGAAKMGSEKKMEMPKPGPEAKKLGYFVGSWKSDAEIKENAMGMPSGKMTETSKCEWFHGGYSVVCHSTGNSPMGPMHAIGILGYDTEGKKYTYYGVDDHGHAEMATGTVEGNTWTYTAEEKMGGKTMHGRYTMMTESPSAYSFKYETSEDGQKWSEVMAGKVTKAGAAEKKEEMKK